jgi:hypothetical protein
MTCRDRVRRFVRPSARAVRVAAFLAVFTVPIVAAGQYPYPDTRLPVDQQLPEFDRVADVAYDDVPAHVAVVDGPGWLEREGRREPLEEGVPLLAGDRIRTERGRAEVLFEDGSAIDIDQLTTIDLLSDTLVRLTAGRIRLAIARATNAIDYRVDAAGSTAWIQSAGEYRVAVRDDRRAGEVELTVLRGQAELETPYGRTRVRAGQQAFAIATAAPSTPYVANASYADDFDRWADDQRDARLGITSARYLPAEVRYYGGAFDTYGSWDYLPTYGNVWYPRVDDGWRPYSHGRWSFYASFGWTWVGGHRWSWPTHHYGRWGYASNRWFWIPGRRWSPAWVSWGYSPGYVSWCPLGYDGRPVIQITNIVVNRVDPWRAWTVLPSRSFTHNVSVGSHIVARSSWPASNWSQVSVRASAPDRPPVRVGTDVAPLRSPSYRGQAVPRNSVGGFSPAARTVAPERSSPASRAATPAARPSGSSMSRVPSVPPAPRGDDALGARTRQGAVTPPSEPSRSRSTVTGPRDARPSFDSAPPDAASRARSRAPIAEPIAPSRSRTPNVEPVAPSRSRTPSYEPPSSARSRSGVAPPPDYRPAPSSREVMPTSPSRTPSRVPSRSVEPPPTDRGAVRQRSGSAPPPSYGPPPSSSAPDRPSRTRSSAPPPSVSAPSAPSRSSATSRAQPRSQPAPPAASSQPSRSRSSDSKAAPPPSSSSGSSRGTAVRRGGGQ